MFLIHVLFALGTAVILSLIFAFGFGRNRHLLLVSDHRADHCHCVAVCVATIGKSNNK
jgi:hypothetical protein